MRLTLKNPPKVEKPAVDKTEMAKLCLRKLVEAYPKAFLTKETRPLKLGVLHDLKEEFGAKYGFKTPLLYSVMHYYTGSTPYLKAVLNGEKRIDLQGEEVEEITKEQKEYSLKVLKERGKKRNQGRGQKPKKVKK